ncbi:phage holin family protein [Mobiluncus mulieris]|uniref:phage holin family protein n=1 Tax=Mobiluncus mulieris TaxID=2052 RepID=UPI00209361B4|nr:phage holin family protein [Mobiluncus mulieris]
MTKAQAKAAAQRFAAAGILLVAALVLALYMLGWLIHAMFLSWQLAVPSWAAALLTAAVLAVLAVILGVAGYAALKRRNATCPIQPKA